MLFVGFESCHKLTHFLAHFIAMQMDLSTNQKCISLQAQPSSLFTTGIYLLPLPSTIYHYHSQQTKSIVSCCRFGIFISIIIKRLHKPSLFTNSAGQVRVRFEFNVPSLGRSPDCNSSCATRVDLSRTYT